MAAKTKTGTASKSKDGSSPSKVTSFTGTSTGTKYSVGQRLTTDRGVVVAQADGSFVNEKTGQRSSGSSQQVAEAMTLQKQHKSGNSRDMTESAPQGGKQTVRVAFAGGSGAGQIRARGTSSFGGGGPGAALAVSQGGFFSSLGGKIETQLLYWGGKQLNTRKDISDGGDWEQRWGEWGGAMAGLAVMGADLTNMASREIDRQKTGVMTMHNAAQSKNILTDDRGKPHGMTEANWLQQKLNEYAASERMTRNHDIGLGAIIGNPGRGTGVYAWDWWK